MQFSIAFQKFKIHQILIWLGNKQIAYFIAIMSEKFIVKRFPHKKYFCTKTF